MLMSLKYWTQGCRITTIKNIIDGMKMKTEGQKRREIEAEET